jgi:Bacterial PH domain
MAYKSKKDTWIIVVIVASIIITSFAGASLILFAPGIWDRFIGMVVLFAALVPVLLTTPVSYTIDSQSIYIRGGWTNWTIPIERILAVRPSRNWIASPALSLDRLEIEYKSWQGTSLLSISPERTSQFLKELSELDPGLILEGDRLSRMDAV